MSEEKTILQVSNNHNNNTLFHIPITWFVRNVLNN